MTLLSQVKSLVANELGVARDLLNARTDLVLDLGADSLDRLAVVDRLEMHFGVAISDSQTRMLHTVGQATQLVRTLIAKQASNV